MTDPSTTGGEMRAGHVAVRVAAVIGIAIGSFLAFVEMAIPGTVLANAIRYGEAKTAVEVLFLLAPWVVWITVTFVGVRRARVRRSWQYGVRWFGVAMPLTGIALVIFVLPAFVL